MLRSVLVVALILPTLLIFSLPVAAQKNFIKGYFVTTANDTIQCFINDKGWNQNPRQIEYKITAAGEAATFRPAEIKSFGLSTGDIYEGRVVTRNNSPKDLEALRLGNTGVTTTDTVFLRVLVRGAANLLYLNNGNRDYFYYQTNADIPVELDVRYTLQQDPLTGKALFITDNRFQAQLKSYFEACPAVVKQLTFAKYNISDLRAAFKAYNACTQNQGYEGAAKNLTLAFGLLGGTSLTYVDFDTPETPSLQHTPFQGGPSLNVGLALNIIIPQNRQKWSFYNELLLKSFKATGSFEEHLPFAYETRHYYTEFDVKSAGLTSMLRYQFLDTPVRPYVNAGFAVNYIFDVQEFQSVRTTFDFTTRETYWEPTPLGVYQQVELALALGAGVTYKKFSLETRVERGDSFSHSLAPSHKIAAMLLLLAMNAARP